MTPRSPIASLPTHDVYNMPPHIGDQDLWTGDRALRHWVGVMHADWATEALSALTALPSLANCSCITRPVSTAVVRA